MSISSTSDLENLGERQFVPTSGASLQGEDHLVDGLIWFRKVSTLNSSLWDRNLLWDSDRVGLCDEAVSADVLGLGEGEVLDLNSTFSNCFSVV